MFGEYKPQGTIKRSTIYLALVHPEGIVRAQLLSHIVDLTQALEAEECKLHVIQSIGVGSIASARDTIIHKLLESLQEKETSGLNLDDSYMLFMDPNLLVKPSDVVNMIELARSDSTRRRVVVGNYPIGVADMETIVEWSRLYKDLKPEMIKQMSAVWAFDPIIDTISEKDLQTVFEQYVQTEDSSHLLVRDVHHRHMRFGLSVVPVSMLKLMRQDGKSKFFSRPREYDVTPDEQFADRLFSRGARLIVDLRPCSICLLTYPSSGQPGALYMKSNFVSLVKQQKEQLEKNKSKE